jgi:hypothetical protein
VIKATLSFCSDILQLVLFNVPNPEWFEGSIEIEDITIDYSDTCKAETARKSIFYVCLVVAFMSSR